MPHSVLRPNRFRRPAGVHHAASPHHPRVPPADVGHGACHPLPVLLYLAFGLSPGLRTNVGLPPRLPRYDLTRSDHAPRRDSRRTARGGRHGSSSLAPLLGHVSGLDLHPASCYGSVFVPAELLCIPVWPPPEMVRH